MNIVVTGGSGFIGSHIVDKLIDSNHRVTVLDIRPPHRKDVTFIKMDLLYLDSLINSFRNTELVFHLAAVSDVNNVIKNPTNAIKVNVFGTKNVLEAARINSLKRIILASTVWVYGGSKGLKVNEESPVNTCGNGCLYTSTKIKAEQLCQYYYQRYSLPFTILRYGIPYGPRAREELAISMFVKKALAGEPIIIFGDGNQFRNFLYVEDLAIGNILAMKEVAKNKIYNLDGNEKVTIKETIEIIRYILGKDIEIKYKKPRYHDYFGKEVSSQKAKKELGWEPKLSFKEGLRRYIEWAREN